MSAREPTPSSEPAETRIEAPGTESLAPTVTAVGARAPRAGSAEGPVLQRQSSGRSYTTGLPRDLEAESARRLRVVALLYSFVFFVANPLTALLFPEDRAWFLSSPLRWAPSTVSIAMALALVALTAVRRIPAHTILAIGLVFEVVGSFGIAAAQYLDVRRYAVEPPWGGLSWVAVWMLSFTILVPTPPRWTLAAALASASAVPIVVGYVAVTEVLPIAQSPARFVMQMVVPYLLVVLIAYVGARVLYRLGAELKRARELGSYRLIERLGEGGMGEVWRARHRLLARPAAVKLMRAEMLSGSGSARLSDLRARFEREAQATASLRSPHTIELYDYGAAGDGTFYYVMELLDGFDLQTLVERFGPLPPARAVHLLLQVCHSLGEAHQVGLVHRDIKPANIYTCRYGRDLDFVKVLDFGLVKPQLDSAHPAVSATQEQAARGTPGFMSPEQVLGTRPLDGRSDIYAVGCVGYWLVTGQLVFPGRTVMETLMHHTQVQPVPPSARSGSEIPPEFDDVILACLAKDPDRRPATADELAARLRAIPLGSPWTAEDAKRWWETHAALPTTPPHGGHESRRGASGESDKP